MSGQALEVLYEGCDFSVRKASCRCASRELEFPDQGMLLLRAPATDNLESMSRQQHQTLYPGKQSCVGPSQALVDILAPHPCGSRSRSRSLTGTALQAGRGHRRTSLQI